MVFRFLSKLLEKLPWVSESSKEESANGTLPGEAPPIARDPVLLRPLTQQQADEKSSEAAG
jgi:hypothetical protein